VASTDGSSVTIRLAPEQLDGGQSSLPRGWYFRARGSWRKATARRRLPERPSGRGVGTATLYVDANGWRGPARPGSGAGGRFPGESRGGEGRRIELRRAPGRNTCIGGREGTTSMLGAVGQATEDLAEWGDLHSLGWNATRFATAARGARAGPGFDARRLRYLVRTVLAAPGSGRRARPRPHDRRAAARRSSAQLVALGRDEGISFPRDRGFTSG